MKRMAFILPGRAPRWRRHPYVGTSQRSSTRGDRDSLRRRQVAVPASGPPEPAERGAGTVACRGTSALRPSGKVIRQVVLVQNSVPLAEVLTDPRHGLLAMVDGDGLRVRAVDTALQRGPVGAAHDHDG